MNLDKLTLDQLHGNQREIAETIGIEAYLKLVERYGSSSIYIGKADEAVRAERDKEIYKRFNGENYLALAHMYSVSEKTVREAIRRQNMIEESRQMTLILDD